MMISLDRTETNFFEGDPLRALSTLAFSDNVDLQRSAALAFAEITEKGMYLPFHLLGTNISSKSTDGVLLHNMIWREIIGPHLASPHACLYIIY